MKRKYSIFAKRWSQLRLMDKYFPGLVPFPGEQEARQAVIHLLDVNDDFRRRYDGWTFYVFAMDSAVLVGQPLSTRMAS